jgi:hypothetical protein
MELYGVQPGKPVNASPEEMAGMALYLAGKHFVLSLKVAGVSLNTWFNGHPNWRGGSPWDRLHVVERNKLPKETRSSIISYRHDSTNAKHLEKGYLPCNTLAVLEDLVRNCGTEALEGLWVDVLCIAPSGQTLKNAFGYMGRLYLDSEVHLCWLQQDSLEPLTRGWIFQECQRSRLSDYTMGLVRRLTNPYIQGQLKLMRSQEAQAVLGPMRATYESSSTLEDVAVCLMHLPFLELDQEADRATAIFGSLEAQHGSRLDSYRFSGRRFVRLTASATTLNRRLEQGVRKAGGSGYSMHRMHADERKLLNVVVFEDYGGGVWLVNVILNNDGPALSYYEIRDYLLRLCAASRPMFTLP